MSSRILKLLTIPNNSPTQQKSKSKPLLTRYKFQSRNYPSSGRRTGAQIAKLLISSSFRWPPWLFHLHESGRILYILARSPNKVGTFSGGCRDQTVVESEPASCTAAYLARIDIRRKGECFREIRPGHPPPGPPPVDMTQVGSKRTADACASVSLQFESLRRVLHCSSSSVPESSRGPGTPVKLLVDHSGGFEERRTSDAKATLASQAGQVADREPLCSNTLFEELENWNEVLKPHKKHLRGPRP